MNKEATHYHDGVAIFNDKKTARNFYQSALKMGFDVIATEIPSETDVIYHIYNLRVHSHKCICSECKEGTR